MKPYKSKNLAQSKKTMTTWLNDNDRANKDLIEDVRNHIKE